MNRYISLSAILIIAFFLSISLANMRSDDSSSNSATKLSDTKSEKNPSPVAADRGKLLYENHCTACHENSVHNRNNNKAKSIEEIRQWVLRWSNNLELGWENNDVNVVSDYINRRFYQFTTEE